MTTSSVNKKNLNNQDTIIKKTEDEKQNIID